MTLELIEKAKKQLRITNPKTYNSFNYEKVIKLNKERIAVVFKHRLHEMRERVVLPRVNLSKVGNVFVNCKKETTHEYLKEINKRYDLSLSEEDVILKRVNTEDFILETKEDSFLYYGNLTVCLRECDQELLEELLSIEIEDSNLYSSGKYLLRHVSFSYMFKHLEKLVQGSVIDEKLYSLLNIRLKDEWNFRLSKEHKNLYGSIIIANESVNVPFINANRLLKVRLNPKYDTSGLGDVEIYY